MHARRLGIGLVSLLLALFTAGAAPRALGGRAAVVVQFADGYRVVRVVTFETATISGMQLLQQSGLAVVDQDGALVCRIGPDGCNYPEAPCFCDPPRFWNYSLWDGQAWRFAATGAAGRTISDGAVDGWAWGNAVRLGAVDPAALFDAQRLAPGLPLVTTEQPGTLGLQVDVQGDSNDNATVAGRYRALGDDWSDAAFVECASGTCTWVLTGLAAGEYEVEVQFADADGVNGSAVWQGTYAVTAPSKAYLPLIGRAESETSQRYGKP